MKKLYDDFNWEDEVEKELDSELFLQKLEKMKNSKNDFLYLYNRIPQEFKTDDFMYKVIKNNGRLLMGYENDDVLMDLILKYKDCSLFDEYMHKKQKNNKEGVCEDKITKFLSDNAVDLIIASNINIIAYLYRFEVDDFVKAFTNDLYDNSSDGFVTQYGINKIQQKGLKYKESLLKIYSKNIGYFSYNPMEVDYVNNTELANDKEYVFFLIRNNMLDYEKLIEKDSILKNDEEIINFIIKNKCEFSKLDKDNKKKYFNMALENKNLISDTDYITYVNEKNVKLCLKNYNNKDSNTFLSILKNNKYIRDEFFNNCEYWDMLNRFDYKVLTGLIKEYPDYVKSFIKTEKGFDYILNYNKILDDKGLVDKFIKSVCTEKEISLILIHQNKFTSKIDTVEDALYFFEKEENTYKYIIDDIWNNVEWIRLLCKNLDNKKISRLDLEIHAPRRVVKYFENNNINENYEIKTMSHIKKRDLNKNLRLSEQGKCNKI